MAVTQSKRAAPRVAFGALVETGLIRPGAMLTDARRRVRARVRPDGSLDMGQTQGSIHQCGAAAQSGPKLQRVDFLARRGRHGAARYSARPVPRGGLKLIIPTRNRIEVISINDSVNDGVVVRRVQTRVVNGYRTRHWDGAALDAVEGVVVDWVRGEWPDLTNRQLALLMIVAIEPGHHFVRELAQRLAVPKSIISRVLEPAGRTRPRHPLCRAPRPPRRVCRRDPARTRISGRRRPRAG